MADYLVTAEVQPGETLTTAKGQKIVDYRNGHLLPLDSSGNRVNASSSLGSASYSWNVGHLKALRILESGSDISEAHGTNWHHANQAVSKGGFLSYRGSNSNGIFLSGLGFLNTNNGSTNGNLSTSTLVAGVYAETVTIDSNGGQDSGGRLVFVTKLNEGTLTERVTILDSGKVGIGTVAPLNSLDVYSNMVVGTNYAGVVTAQANGLSVQGKILSGGGSSPTSTGFVGIGHIHAETDSFTAISCVAHSNSSGDYPILQFVKSRGTQASPTIVAASDILCSIAPVMYDGATYRVSAEFNAYVDGTPGSGDCPTGWVWKTCPEGSATTTNRMWLTSAGFFGLGIASPDSMTHIFGGSAGTVSATANTILTLENTSAVDLQFLTSNTGVQSIWFGDADDNDVGGIKYLHSTNVMDFYRAAAVGMSLDASGLSVTGGIDAGDTGVYTKTKRVAITNWNMDSTASISVAHGLADITKVVSVAGVIFSDDLSKVTFFGHGADTSDNSPDAVFGYMDATNIGATRANTSPYDGADYDSVGGFVRGYFYITYTV